MERFKIAIFASGNGSNAEAIMAYFKDNPYISVAALLTNNPNAYAIERAKKFAVLCEVFTKQDFQTEDFAERLRTRWGITHIVLAGFLWLVPETLIKAFPNRIINIHPALLPKYGGKGMYGVKVHEAVKSSGDLQTGITIHLVNSKYDEGEVLAQIPVDIDLNHSVEEIAKKVHELEHKYYPEVIDRWISRKE
jgi:phosphoribosylglycinamide formyltransferase-1